MFGKKKEQKIETGGVTYRRAKTWQIALASCSSGIGMSFYVLLGLASYVAIPYPIEPHLPSLNTARPVPVIMAVLPVKNPINLISLSVIFTIIRNKLKHTMYFR